MSLAGWKEGARLAPLTSWQIGGRCHALCEPESAKAFIEAHAEAERRAWPLFLLGGGTNLLIADQGYPGLVVRLGGRSHRFVAQGETALVRAEARHSFARLARETARQGWSGLVWAEGIPGTVGGAVVGNAGAYGGEVAQTIERIEIVTTDGREETWSVEQMQYAYRHSVLKGQERAGPAVLAAWFRLRREDPQHLLAECKRIAAERKRRTPAGSTCGSVFRNPPGNAAGRLIEAAGCKGLRVGAAVVSEKHANYIVNDGGATAREVRTLIEQVRERVRTESGVSLELEIQLVGFEA